MNATVQEKKLTRRITMILAVVILVPCLLGFGNKMIEFVALVQGEQEGMFALTPVTNYLLASLGFFCMLCWAALNGMFRNIEGPKHDLLEQERELDRGIAAAAVAHHSVVVEGRDGERL